MLAYHDLEWGVPVRDERMLFERLTLEGAQAGLSWSLILAKREGYRRAFADFAPDLVAAFDDADVERLVADASIVRNRQKIESSCGSWVPGYDAAPPTPHARAGSDHRPILRSLQQPSDTQGLRGAACDDDPLCRNTRHRHHRARAPGPVAY